MTFEIENVKPQTTLGRKENSYGGYSFQDENKKTRREGRQQLYELAKLRKNEHFEPVITHLMELATDKYYPDDEQQHARDLLYKLFDIVDSLELSEKILTAHLYDLESETNRKRSVEITHQYSSLLPKAIESFTSATTKGKTSRKYSGYKFEGNSS